MNPAMAATTPDLVFSEIAHLHEHGFSLVPLGGGKDGKSPLVRFADRRRLPLALIISRLQDKNSYVYGIRLDGLTVVDIDTDDDELTRELEARFGCSPVQVRTPRGRHLYYLSSPGKLPYLKGEEINADIKSAKNSYAVGPYSMRADGGAYLPCIGILGETPLNQIRLDPPVAIEPPSRSQSRNQSRNPNRASGRIPRGVRNESLTTIAVRLVPQVASPDELASRLCEVRDELCEEPGTVSDLEIQKIADWAWSIRLNNRIFAGRDSAFLMPRSAIDRLKASGNSSDAIALLTILTDIHGHQPGKQFSLVHAAMRNAGHTDLSRERLARAIRTLLECNLLEQTRGPVPGKRCRQFRLTRPVPAGVERLTGDLADG